MWKFFRNGKILLSPSSCNLQNTKNVILLLFGRWWCKEALEGESSQDEIVGCQWKLIIYSRRRWLGGIFRGLQICVILYLEPDQLLRECWEKLNTLIWSEVETLMRSCRGWVLVIRARGELFIQSQLNQQWYSRYNARIIKFNLRWWVNVWSLNTAFNALTD